MIKFIIFILIILLIQYVISFKISNNNYNNNNNNNNNNNRITTKLRLEMSSSLVSKTLLSSTLALSLSLGNIGEAITAIVKNPEAITCTLDTQQADEYHGSCQLLDDVVRLRAGKLLTIRQDWGGSASTGAAVWNGANMAGWYLENEISNKKMKDASVLELGAGVGFSSLVAQALGSNDVVVTDGNEDVLKLANENIRINVPGKLY